MFEGTMGLFLTKVFAQLIYPLGLVCALLGLGLLLLSAWARFARVMVGSALLILWGASLPPVSLWAIGTLEQQYPPRSLSDTQSADVAILLGGGVEPPGGRRLDAEFNDGGDRVIYAARLYKAGKVQRILVTGGNVPWVTDGRPEAQFMRDYLLEFGVPEAAISFAGKSRNTAENAKEVVAMWAALGGYSSALLVTSAAHMPRAMDIFTRAGLPVLPASTDVRGVGPSAFTMLDCLPDAEALARTTRALKEWLGILSLRATQSQFKK